MHNDFRIEFFEAISMLTILPLNLPPIMGSEIKKGVLNVIRICTGEITIEITIYAVKNEFNDGQETRL